jgi:hypothetical protein
LGVGLTTLPYKKKIVEKPDFVEEAKAKARLWSQGKKNN